MKISKSMRLIGAMLVFAASPSAFAELCTVGRNTEVLWKGSWYKASVVESGKSRCYVTYAGYDNSYDEWVGPERLKIKVLWKGDWYSAKVLSREDTGYLITYDGYKSSDDEVVPLSRIQIR